MSLAGALERFETADAGPVLHSLPTASATRGRGSQSPTLPVLPALASLLPDGALRRGSTVAVAGSTALALALLAGPSRSGAWCAVVGLPTLGLRAAAEFGVALDRLAVVPAPGGQWAAAVAALFDGVDVVAVRPPARVSLGESRRLMARARERGTTLVPLGPWDGADLRLAGSDPQWTGLSAGVGRLHARQLQITTSGRGAAARPRHATVWLPATQGEVCAVADELPRLHSAAV